MKQPNILFITTDEQHMRTLTCYGSKAGVTPVLDTLAQNSDVYEQAYTVSPVCLPARCAFMTGMYPHHSGSVSNVFGASVSRSYPNLFTELKKQGYITALHGKCHFIPVPYPATRRDMTLEYEHFMTYYRSLGMDKLSLQDDKNNSLWYYDDYAKELFRRGMLKKCRYEAHEKPDNPGYYDFPFSSDMHPDAWVAQKAIEDIRSRSTKEPNFLWVSFSGPHYPVDTPAEYIEKVDPDKMEPRIFREDEWEDETKFHFRGYHGPGTTEGSGHVRDGAQKHYSEAYWTEWRRRYLGNLALIDEGIGRILDAARDKFGDNLTVIFTTDHGEMMGNHSLWGKNGALFEDVLRIPLLVHQPGQTTGRKIKETVSSLELFPTILTYAGAPIPDSCDGTTLESMVRSGGRPYIISECDNRVAVIKDGLKLELNRSDLGQRTYKELYDLSKDPYEFINRYEDEEYKDAIRGLTKLLDAEPYLMETIFWSDENGRDYWLDGGNGAGLAANERPGEEKPYI